MRILLKVEFPNESFNKAIKDGSIGEKINRALESTKADAVYFTEMHGRRTAIQIVDIPDPSKVPAFGEPWFLMFNAEVEFHTVLSPEDIVKAGLEALGKKWA